MYKLRQYVAMLAVLMAGCGSAVSSGTNTALSGMDLQQMTDQMSMSILASPAVQDAIVSDGKLRIVVEPVENLMTAEILPRGPAEAFTARVRALLAQHAPDRFTWIMNRDAYYRLRASELEKMDLGPNPESVQPKYALHSRFYSITNETSKSRSSSYLCVYEITDLQSREVLWTDKYEVQKMAVKGWLD
jgi:hypothetical protein